MMMNAMIFLGLLIIIRSDGSSVSLRIIRVSHMSIIQTESTDIIIIIIQTEPELLVLPGSSENSHRIKKKLKEECFPEIR